MDRIPIKTNPKMFDKAFGYIQTALGSELSWLDHVFGKAERLCKIINGKRIYSPNVYVGSNEYELITPDTDGIGNYSFFVLEEPQTIEYDRGSRVNATAPFSLIVWCNVANIDTDDERNAESIKQSILQVLTNHVWMRSGSFTINKIFERAENVFKEFTMDEVDNQFLMHPYCGWRFQGEITIDTECES